MEDKMIKKGNGTLTDDLKQKLDSVKSYEILDYLINKYHKEHEMDDFYDDLFDNILEKSFLEHISDDILVDYIERNDYLLERVDADINLEKVSTSDLTDELENRKFTVFEGISLIDIIGEIIKTIKPNISFIDSKMAKDIINQYIDDNMVNPL